MLSFFIQICESLTSVTTWYQSSSEKRSKNNVVNDESGSANVRDGGVNTAGFVCSCAGHGGAEGQGQAQTRMTGSGQWYIDSGATHHVTPEETKVVQGTEYGGPDAKSGIVPSTRATTERSSNELLVIPELDKLRGRLYQGKMQLMHMSVKEVVKKELMFMKKGPVAGMLLVRSVKKKLELKEEF
ncbi:hypothetical protein V6N11_056980 [Hibiscus sabdariffa]|uniref:Uncharacterized protein n=1 Tax=Hibiscus sabdariffa TaxID=183260 RepID=A0ABR2T6D6_9ROSI